MTERLTKKTDEGIWVKESHGENVMKTLYQCYGAEPLPNYSNCDEGYCGMEKLAEYETAEEEGRMVVLPCKNWLDIVFGEQELFYGIDMDYIENPIREITVHNEERFTWYDGWKTVVLKGVDENGLDWEFAPEEIGKTVFLTREKAEKELREMEGK